MSDFDLPIRKITIILDLNLLGGTIKYYKISNTVHFLFSNKMWGFWGWNLKKIYACLNSKQANPITLNQTASLGLHCLSRLFWQATSV